VKLRVLPVALALATLGVPVARSSPTTSAELLVQQGEAREAEGDELVALRRYRDALSIDPTSERAYVRLGALRARRNELVEAEGVYDVGLVRVPGSVELYFGRAKVRRARGHLVDAHDDLRRARALEGASASPRERAIVRETIALAREARWQATELAAWRRLLAIGHKLVDAGLIQEASVQARALGLFVGEIDPVLGGGALTDPLRRSLASVARRGG
jgi:tetratricopeptide (TPR) repeat protein